MNNSSIYRIQEEALAYDVSDEQLETSSDHPEGQGRQLHHLILLRSGHLPGVRAAGQLYNSLSKGRNRRLGRRKLRRMSWLARASNC